MIHETVTSLPAPEVLARAKAFFGRERKRFDLASMYTSHPQLDPLRNGMLALDELFGIVIALSGVILGRDLHPYRYRCALCDSCVMYDHRKCLRMGYGSICDLEQDEATRAYADCTD